MRFFIALEIPEESKQELKVIQSQIKEIIPQVRLTDNDKLHLTITFIGEQPENLKDKLIELINNSVVDISPFIVTPALIDGFPNIHNPKILWIGIKGDIDKILLIRERIKDSLASLNLDVDIRRFIPHIAVAKVTNFKISKLQEAQIQKIMQKEFEPIKVKSIKLFESVPNLGFHKHNTLAEIFLTS
ncbi:RNA 2',3'-cyclic phosphodiesterase [Candidatus Daviesbacteria bacterium]|nr:RNA 2',3'-cyclic phosphodiesterase [Candidatus Daviesbacteria bacterium]